MTLLLRYLKPHANAKWQYEEYRDRQYSSKCETAFEQAIKRQRLYPHEYHSWAIIRLSDMRILAQSKEYRA